MHQSLEGQKILVEFQGNLVNAVIIETRMVRDRHCYYVEFEDIRVKHRWRTDAVKRAIVEHDSIRWID